MKKYFMLVLSTTLALALLMGIRLWKTPSATTVQLVTVEAQTVRQTVSCTGKVQASDSKEVYVDLPCIAQEVFVKQGETVKQGDPLFSVDVEATEQALAQLSGSLPANALSENRDTTITAPASGTVVSLNVQPGGIADSSEPCAVIATGDGLQIAVSVREKDIAHLAVGQAVEVTGIAFSKEKYHGTITQIARTAHQQYLGTASETVVDAVVLLSEEELDDSLRTGLNARATVIVDTLEGALLVPYTCIAQDEEGEEYVYVYQNDGTALRQQVSFGSDFSDGVLVVSGLAPGAQLVQNPEALSGERARVRVE